MSTWTLNRYSKYNSRRKFLIKQVSISIFKSYFSLYSVIAWVLIVTLNAHNSQPLFYITIDWRTFCLMKSPLGKFNGLLNWQDQKQKNASDIEIKLRVHIHINDEHELIIFLCHLNPFASEHLLWELFIVVLKICT